MKGCVSEELLALFVSDDLDAQERVSVCAHLAECATCRSVVDELELSRQVLADAFEEPAEEDLRFVRTGVSRRMSPPPRQAKWFRLSASVAAVAVLLTSSLIHFWSAGQTAAPVPAPHHEPLLAQQPVQITPSATPSTMVRRVHRRVYKSIPEAGLASAVLMTNALGKPELKMLTNDPNVVILLQMDGDTHAN